ncbi:putative 3-hydroxypropionyl-coenzyme A dehydratase [[Clostridium] ultunense Esp]|nr:putative 3-hydroxypropionyl-coenzyme A dehydratase [[Clostridium] ultunense Esp]
MATVMMEQRGNLLWLILNRPDVYHAINFQVMDELEDLIRFGNGEEKIHAILLTGSGEKAFASGGDVREFHSFADEKEVIEMLSRMARLLEEISASPKLTVAAINGLALGGGAEITTAFDLRAASEDARIGFIQRNLHLTTGWGGGTRLMHLLGADRAFPLLLSGKIYSAKEWHNWGYLHALFPKEEFRERVENWVKEILPAPEVLLSYKRMKNRIERGKKWKEEIEKEVKECAKLWMSPEHHKKVEAFLSKNRES